MKIWDIIQASLQSFTNMKIKITESQLSHLLNKSINEQSINPELPSCSKFKDEDLIGKIISTPPKASSRGAQISASFRNQTNTQIKLVALDKNNKPFCKIR